MIFVCLQISPYPMYGIIIITVRKDVGVVSRNESRTVQLCKKKVAHQAKTVTHHLFYSFVAPMSNSTCTF